MSRDRHTDDRRSDRVRTDDVYENEDERGGFLAPIGWPSWPGTGAAEETPNERFDEQSATGGGERGGRGEHEKRDDSRWGEKLIPVLFVGGLVLFFFPEPITSAAGVVLMSAGVVLWAVDRFR